MEYIRTIKLDRKRIDKFFRTKSEKHGDIFYYAIGSEKELSKQPDRKKIMISFPEIDFKDEVIIKWRPNDECKN